MVLQVVRCAVGYIVSISFLFLFLLDTSCPKIPDLDRPLLPASIIISAFFY